MNIIIYYEYKLKQLFYIIYTGRINAIQYLALTVY